MEEAAERLERWVVLHQPIVYRAAWLIVRDRSAAEDVAQETFLRAFRNAHRLPSDADARPWLYRIAVNLALNQLRSRRREQRALARINPPAQHWDDDGVARDIDDSPLSEALRSLPDRLRVPLILRYYLDLSDKEIARAAGLRPGTVKSRLHEGRRLLAADESLSGAAKE